MLAAIMRGQLIGNSVGNMMANEEGDVRRVKKVLTSIGKFDNTTTPEPHGIVTREMDTAIKSYQAEKGLKVDGVMKPQGETESSMLGTILAQPLFAALREPQKRPEPEDKNSSSSMSLVQKSQIVSQSEEGQEEGEDDSNEDGDGDNENDKDPSTEPPPEDPDKNENKEECKSLKQEIDAKQNEIDAKEQEINAIRGQIEELNTEIEKAQDEYRDLAAEYGSSISPFTGFNLPGRMAGMIQYGLDEFSAPDNYDVAEAWNRYQAIRAENEKKANELEKETRRIGQEIRVLSSEKERLVKEWQHLGCSRRD